MITAHSGCDETPENSLEFLRTALQSEADAVEVDVRKNGEGRDYRGLPSQNDWIRTVPPNFGKKPSSIYHLFYGKGC